MNQNSIPIRLKDNRIGEPVDAILYEGLTAEQVQDAQAKWGPARQAAILRLYHSGVPAERLPKHYGWNWNRKITILPLPIYAFYGIECEREMQGLMMVSKEGHFGRLSSQQGRPLIYIDFLETAPWNIRLLEPNPLFGGIGSRLFRAAIELSLTEGYKGRIGLHSLPSDEPGGPEWFYEQICHMVPLGADPAKEDLVYFELTPESADDFLHGGRP